MTLREPFHIFPRHIPLPHCFVRTALLAFLLATLSTSSTVAQPLQVSANGRYLSYPDGKPFFYLGDTAWELFHRLTLEEADRYLQNRAVKGFTVIQATLLAELSGLDTPNANGDRPLLDNDPLRPNEAYFRHADRLIDRAGELGLYMAILPTWGDKLHKSTWGIGPEIFDSSNIYHYGFYLGKRYKDRSNIIWVIGGDRNPRDSSSDVAVWRALARGITEGVGGAEKALMTFHPQTSSARWFHHDEWLDFNMFQSSHCATTKVWKNIRQDYNRLPVKPVLDGEPLYEEIPLCFDVKNGYSSPDDVRRKAYQNLFAGASGHTYGCNNIWQMYVPGRKGILSPTRPWYESLDLPGAVYMTYVKRIMTARPLEDRFPDTSLLTTTTDDPQRWIGALRGKDYALVYTTSGKPFEVMLERLSGRKIKTTWYNPRTGLSQKGPSSRKKGIKLFSPPREQTPGDWVLILDDSRNRYTPPGG